MVEISVKGVGTLIFPWYHPWYQFIWIL